MQQIDIVLQKHELPPLNADLAVKFHAFLMASVNTEISRNMHTSDEIRPFSIFTREQARNIVVRLSIFHDVAIPLINIARAMPVLNVSGVNSEIKVLNRIEKPSVGINELYKPTPKEFHIIFASPVSYKHNKKPSNLYSLPPLLYPVAEKLRVFEGIDISKEEVAEISDLVTYAQYNFHTLEYKLSPGLRRPAFMGEMRIHPDGNREQCKKLALLLRYASYTGVGAKTALGMGGILLAEY